MRSVALHNGQNKGITYRTVSCGRRRSKFGRGVNEWTTQREIETARKESEDKRFEPNRLSCSLNVGSSDPEDVQLEEWQSILIRRDGVRKKERRCNCDAMVHESGLRGQDVDTIGKSPRVWPGHASASIQVILGVPWRLVVENGRHGSKTNTGVARSGRPNARSSGSRLKCDGHRANDGR